MDKIKIEDKKFLNYCIMVFLIFMIGSIFGCILETLLISVKLQALEIRKGLIYGPFVQVYGMGTVIYYILFEIINKERVEGKDIIKENRKENIKEKRKSRGILIWIQIFLISMFLGGITEYVCSFLLEIFTGKVSWDYSNYFMNFNGRTSMSYMLIWGAIGILFGKFIYPLFKKIEKVIYIKWFRKFILVIFIFMCFNAWVSAVSTLRQIEREDKIEAKGNLDIFLDKYYPDELLNKIYHNRYDAEEL